MARKIKYKPFDVVYYRRPYRLKKYKSIVKVACHPRNNHDNRYVIIPLEGEYSGHELLCTESSLYPDNNTLQVKKITYTPG